MIQLLDKPKFVAIGGELVELNVLNGLAQPVDIILGQAVRQLQEIWRGAHANSDVGDELRRALPTLQARGRARLRTRDREDRRRSADVRVRFGALDHPGYTNTNHIDQEELAAKGLWRPYTTTSQCDRIPVSWGTDAIYAFIQQRFPVLRERTFTIHQGIQGSKIQLIENVTGEMLRAFMSNLRNIIRLWVIPDEPIVHFPTDDTPAIQAFGPVMARLVPADTEETPSRGTVPEPATIPETQPEINHPETPPPAQEEGHIDTLHLQLDDSFTDDENITLGDLTRLSGFENLKAGMSGPPVLIVAQRSNIVESVLSCYEDLDTRQQITVTFEGELGEDFSGLTRDMLTLFMDRVFDQYFTGTDVVTPRPPLIQRRKSQNIFKVIGKVIEHYVVHFGNFPQRLATSVVLSLCSSDLEIPDDVLLKDFLSFQSMAQGALLQQSLSDITWTDSQRLRLMRFYSVSRLQTMPSPARLKDDVLCVARAELVDQSLVFISYIRSGFSPEFKNTLSGFTVDSVIRLRSTVEATPDKVAQLIDSSFLGDASTDLRLEEEVVVNFLSDFVRELSNEQLRWFLVWATGSSLMPEKLVISFNGTFGLGRCPVAHTCGPNLELPIVYDDYRDFRKEFLAILNNEECMQFSTL